MPATLTFSIINGIPDYKYELLTPLSVVVQSGTTSTTGTYFFYGVNNGTYTIRVTDGNDVVFNQPVIVNCAL